MVVGPKSRYPVEIGLDKPGVVRDDEKLPLTEAMLPFMKIDAKSMNLVGFMVLGGKTGKGVVVRNGCKMREHIGVREPE